MRHNAELIGVEMRKIFPDAKMRSVDSYVKINVDGINDNQCERLGQINNAYGDGFVIKRSGIGILIAIKVS